MLAPTLCAKPPAFPDGLIPAQPTEQVLSQLMAALRHESQAIEGHQPHGRPKQVDAAHLKRRVAVPPLMLRIAHTEVDLVDVSRFAAFPDDIYQ